MRLTIGLMSFGFILLQPFVLVNENYSVWNFVVLMELLAN